MRRTHETIADKEAWLEEPFTLAHRDWLTGEVQLRLKALLGVCAETLDVTVARSFERFRAVDRDLAFFSTLPKARKQA